jgi:hypothetical protein
LFEMRKQMKLTKPRPKSLEVEWIKWIDGRRVLMEGICWWKKHVDRLKAEAVFLCSRIRLCENELIVIDGLHLPTLRVAERVEPCRNASKWFDFTSCTVTGSRWERFGWKQGFGESGCEEKRQRAIPTWKTY